MPLTEASYRALMESGEVVSIDENMMNKIIPDAIYPQQEHILQHQKQFQSNSPTRSFSQSVCEDGDTEQQDTDDTMANQSLNLRSALNTMKLPFVRSLLGADNIEPPLIAQRESYTSLMSTFSALGNSRISLTDLVDGTPMGISEQSVVDMSVKPNSSYFDESDKPFKLVHDPSYVSVSDASESKHDFSSAVNNVSDTSSLTRTLKQDPIMAYIRDERPTFNTMAPYDVATKPSTENVLNLDSRREVFAAMGKQPGVRMLHPNTLTTTSGYTANSGQGSPTANSMGCSLYSFGESNALLGSKKNDLSSGFFPDGATNNTTFSWYNKNGSYTGNSSTPFYPESAMPEPIAENGLNRSSSMETNSVMSIESGRSIFTDISRISLMSNFEDSPCDLSSAEVTPNCSLNQSSLSSAEKVLKM